MNNLSSLRIDTNGLLNVKYVEVIGEIDHEQ